MDRSGSDVQFESCTTWYGSARV